MALIDSINICFCEGCADKRNKEHNTRGLGRVCLCYPCFKIRISRKSVIFKFEDSLKCRSLFILSEVLASYTKVGN